MPLALLLASACLFILTPDAAAASPPSVQITSPTSGATVEGTIRIEASATATPGDHPEAINFYDGVNNIGSASCEGQQTCQGYVLWEATGLSGLHTLTARAVTAEGESETSAPINVTVVSPPPSVRITSPTAGATVAGTVMVSVEAATDPSQEDYPSDIVVYDGVNTLGDVECQGQQTCQGQVEWPATGLTGTHNLTAKVATHRRLSVTSTPLPVTVLSPSPTVTITHPRTGAPLRGTISIAVSAATDPTQADYPTSITVYDAESEIGSLECQGQRTCGGTVAWGTSGLKGTQAIHATVHTRTGREATSKTVYVGGYPSLPHARVSCRIASLRVPVRYGDRVSCVAANLPAGTAVAIQYRTASHHWASLFHEQVPADGHFIFTVRGKRRSTIQLSVIIARTSHYSATRIPVGTLHIA